MPNQHQKNNKINDAKNLFIIIGAVIFSVINSILLLTNFSKIKFYPAYYVTISNLNISY